ncbi:MAG: hypothetical protein AB1696_24900 [Planctomycetota bacterium]
MRIVRRNGIIVNTTPKNPLAPSRAGIGGPKTPEGKAISCRNALKHGMCAEKLGLNNAQREDFAALWEQFLEEYQPDSPTEETLLRKMWRHACFLRIIAEGESSAGWGIYQKIAGDAGAQDPFEEARARQTAIEAASLQLATRYRVAHERGFHAAYRALMMHRALVRTQESVDSIVPKIENYETNSKGQNCETNSKGQNYETNSNS